MSDIETRPTTTLPTTGPAKPEEPNPTLEARIRIRAYELYEERKDAPGDPVSDWVRAEQEIAGTAAGSKN